MLPNTGHNILFTLWQHRSWSNPIYVYFLMFRLQYSIERISVDIGDMSTTHWALYSTFAVKYRAQYPVYAISILVPVKCNIITVLLMQGLIYNWTYLRCEWWFIDKSVRVILHVFRQIQGTISSLRYPNSGPGIIQYENISWCWGFNIQLNVSPLTLVICRQLIERYTPHLLSNTEHNIRFTLCQLWCRSKPIQLNFLLSGFNVQLNVSSSILVVCRQCNARYNPHL
jgi:hypothetical protein